MVWQEKQKIPSSLLPFGRRDERMKNLPRYHSSSPPKRGHTQRDTIISPPCNGSARPRLLDFSGVARAASSAVPSTLCLAPPGTSLRARRCLLLCVIAFDVLNDNRRRPESQVKNFRSGRAFFGDPAQKRSPGLCRGPAVRHCSGGGQGRAVIPLPRLFRRVLRLLRKGAGLRGLVHDEHLEPVLHVGVAGVRVQVQGQDLHAGTTPP